MGLSGTIRAAIAFLAAIVMLYITSITFGATMDALYIRFYDMATTQLHLGTGWSGVAVSVLGGWVWFFRAFIICAIAVGVWFVESAIVDIDYGRQQQRLR